ncbi:hypothetical protein Tco_0597832 [Tanacetum coccineum]
MENEHELTYETLKRVYLGSYEHFKSVEAEVEHPEPGFELQGAKMMNLRIIWEQRMFAQLGYRKDRDGDDWKTDIEEKDEKRSQNDKTEHGVEKREKDKVQSSPSLKKSTQVNSEAKSQEI